VLDHERWADGDHKDVAREIARLGLEREAYELEVFGLTVVPAERTGAAGIAARAFERVCELIEERTGAAPDTEAGTTHVDVVVPSLHHVIHEGEPFEQLVMHPIGHALASLLVGRRWLLSGTEVFMKGPATGADVGPLRRRNRDAVLQLGLHSDMVTFPEPFPAVAPLCNMTWMLSDYTRDDGALAFVPGSHRLCRQPHPGEGIEAAVPVEAPMGSMVIWHGNTWHGSYPRTRPGLRTGLAFALVREYFHPHEPVRRDVTDEMIERNGPRFARVAGHHVVDWDIEGPDYDKLLERPFRYTPLT
jgi:hypothetical protein